jgi:hypothetical protein
MFLRTHTTGGRTYLLLVESERVDGKIKQRALHRLGRLDQTQASGQLDALISALGRFSTKLAVLGAYDRGESVTTRTRSIGPALIFERLWLETGIRAVLEDALRERRFEFSVERAVFLTVLHRLFVSGSDRAAGAGGTDRRCAEARNSRRITCTGRWAFWGSRWHRRKGTRRLTCARARTRSKKRCLRAGAI